MHSGSHINDHSFVAVKDQLAEKPKWAKNQIGSTRKEKHI
jgi:hypothetical protein